MMAEKTELTSETPRLRSARKATEAILLGMAFISPWLFGSVDAWAQLLIGIMILLLALLGMVIGWETPRLRLLICAPSVVLLGLSALAYFQSVPLSAGQLKQLAPTTYALIARLSTGGGTGVLGAEVPPVPAPDLTLSQNPDASVHTAYQFLAAWIIFQSVLLVGNGYSTLRRFGLVTAINACLLTVFGIAQSLTWNGKIFGIRPTPIVNGWSTGGPFVGHNHYAAFLNLGLGFAFGFFFSGGHRQRADGPIRRSREGAWANQGWAVYAIGLIAAGITASHSRGGFLSMVISTLVIMLIIRPRTLKAGAGIAVVLLLIPIFLVAVGSDAPFRRIASILDSYDTGFNHRTEVWQAAIQAWRTYPVWGAGLGAFGVSAAPFVNAPRQTFYWHAENEYLQYLEEGGVIGFGLVLLGIVAIGRFAWRARNAATNEEDRSMVIGAMYGFLSLMTESLSDFALHIPAVAISGIILTAHLCRLGLEASKKGDQPAERAGGFERSLSGAIGFAALCLGVMVVYHGAQYALVEKITVDAGLPRSGSGLPLVYDRTSSTDELHARERALEEAFKIRPDWVDGHVLHGLTELALYERFAREEAAADAEALKAANAAKQPAEQPGKESEKPRVRRLRDVVDPEEEAKEQAEVDLALRSDVLWLHGAVHSLSKEEREKLLAETNSPIRQYLVPSAYSFLEARRCCPVLGTPHAYLGTLDYLLDGGEPAATYARRTIEQSGPLAVLDTIAAQVAFDVGDRELAARCWRRALRGLESEWGPIARASATMFTPQELLDKVLPQELARYPILFADHLYGAPEAKEARDLLLRAGIARIPSDRTLGAGERYFWEGEARALLGETDAAQDLLKKALQEEPHACEWWAMYIEWLIRWDRAKEAHLAAQVAQYYCPGHVRVKKATTAAFDALADPDKAKKLR
jgi:O-antigen ligase